MSLDLRIAGNVTGFTDRRVGRLVRTPVDQEQRAACFLAAAQGTPLLAEDIRGYAAVLTDYADVRGLQESGADRLVTEVRGLSTVSPGSVVAVAPRSKSVHLLYRPESDHNALFMTARCNSNCIMCSQPPITDGRDEGIAEHVRAIELIEDPPQWLGITGGEPTLLGSRLIDLIEIVRLRLPRTKLQLLTNGRLLADGIYTARLAEALPEGSIVAVPLYADDAATHDYVVQARGAFNETIRGIYNLARFGVAVEIRVVLHKATIPRLLPTSAFLYRNMPFVSHVALMGLENMGYVKRNWNAVWIDPVDYVSQLEQAVRFLHLRRMRVSLFNLPLCILPRTIWGFARKSISDHKNVYLDACERCIERDRCGGLFQSSERHHSRAISPIEVPAP